MLKKLLFMEMEILKHIIILTGALSDIRLKENIEPIRDYTDDLKK